MVEGLGTYSDLVASLGTSDKPIVAGIWTFQDVDKEYSPFEAEWDEVKYVVKGEVTFKDVGTGEEFNAKAGDFIWFPTGSKTSLLHSKNLMALYTEQRHAYWGVESIGLSTKLQPRLENLIQWFINSNPKSAQGGQGCSNSAPWGKHEDCFTPNTFSDRGAIGTEAEFGSLIQQRFSSMELMRFTDSGTEANTLALASALSYTGQKELHRFLCLAMDTMEALSFPNGSSPPTNLLCQYLMGKFNDIETTRRLFHHGIGAILVEPLQYSGRMISAKPEFLQFLRDAANAFNAVLIFDEVVTSRLHYHGLQARWGFKDTLVGTCAAIPTIPISRP
ncbi:pyridoxal phosphate-dependent transferase [Phaeosphaeriaceae sp. PMI808]|nr:pyridoxal phosphate-dependent transferase [Phaeosphaeriaceae sp. PMI808]